VNSANVSGGSLRSGELAKLTQVSTDTLRHYERIGLLPRPPRSAGGYRQYSPDSVPRVRLVQSALSIGFSLRELVRILHVRDRGGAPCKQVRALASRKLEEIGRRIVELQRFEKQLSAILSGWDERLSRTPDGRRAGLLESLLDLPSGNGDHNAL
jgi:DNA-binding transcriptional MerR regulator